MKIVKTLLKILGFAVAALFAFILTLIVVLTISFGRDAFEERSLGEYPSPDGKHVCSVLVANGGATTPYTVIAQVSGTWMIGKRTIYIADHIDTAKVIWVDDRTVWINGVSVDIYRDKYVGDIDELYGP